MLNSSDTILNTQRSLVRVPGFTLLEVVVVLLIMSTISAIGVSQLAELQSSFARNSARREFLHDLMRTKNEALSAGARAIIQVAADGMSYDVGLDYLPFSNPAVSERALFKRDLGLGVSMSTNQTIVFDSRGFLVNSSGAITSTNVSFLNNGSSYYSATIYPTGVMQ